MATYLYCLRGEPGEPPVGLTGIDGSIVYAIDSARLAAWVSDVKGSVEPTVDRVKAHDTVCAAAMSEGETPLPIRFGQLFADAPAAIAAIESREAALHARLARVAGCVELRVVVTKGRESDVNLTGGESDATDSSPGAESTLAGPGTAFLRRLARAGREDLAREVGCEEIRHAIRTAAQPVIVAQQPCESARGMAYFPVLVRRANVGAFRAAVAELVEAQTIGLSVLGPFAPYSFAGDA